MIRPAVLLAATLLVLAAHHAGYAQDGGLTKLAPEPILIQVENGMGSTQVIFAKKVGLKRPEFKVTDAIGPNNIISGKEIRFEWVNDPPQSERGVETIFSMRGQSASESEMYLDGCHK